MDAAEDELGDTSEAYTWGAELGQNFADGIWSKVDEVRAASNALAEAAAGPIHHSTPSIGPLAGDDKWGGELAETFAKTMVAKSDQVGRAAMGVAKAAADGLRRDVSSRDLSFEATVKTSVSGKAGKDTQDRIIVENRFYLGERDITALITKKVVKRVTEMQRAASLAKGGAAYV